MDAATLLAMTVHEVPLLSVYSSFTLDTPEEAQVMARLLPPLQLSPPLGEVTVRLVASGAVVVAEAVLLTGDSLPAASWAVTR